MFAAHARETAKTSKYRKAAEAESATFVPFVLETFGGFGTQALKFVSDVASLVRENLSLAQSEPDCSMVRSLDCPADRKCSCGAMRLAFLARTFWQVDWDSVSWSVSEVVL